VSSGAEVARELLEATRELEVALDAEEPERFERALRLRQEAFARARGVPPGHERDALRRGVAGLGERDATLVTRALERIDRTRRDLDDVGRLLRWLRQLRGTCEPRFVSRRV
jgi:hypothetical protein